MNAGIVPCAHDELDPEVAERPNTTWDADNHSATMGQLRNVEGTPFQIFNCPAQICWNRVALLSLVVKENHH